MASMVAVVASASPVFYDGLTVTTVDRSATFDSLNGMGLINLSSYNEDSLFVTANNSARANFVAFPSLDSRTIGYHYGNGGDSAYVTIKGTDSAVFTAVDFLLGDGYVTAGGSRSLRWESYLNGVITGSGHETGLLHGQYVGWTAPAGFDELRVAAAPEDDVPSPGFGNWQAIAIDDLRVQAIPEPASLGLLGLISGGIYFSRRFFVV